MSVLIVMVEFDSNPFFFYRTGSNFIIWGGSTVTFTPYAGTNFIISWIDPTTYFQKQFYLIGTDSGPANIAISAPRSLSRFALMLFSNNLTMLLIHNEHRVYIVVYGFTAATNLNIFSIKSIGAT